MSSKQLKSDINFAYPSSEVAVMGPDGAVPIIFRNELKESKDPEKERARLVEEYSEKFASPYKAAELGYIDGVIFPENTRPQIIQALEMLKHKRDKGPSKKHGNIPL